MKNAGQWVEDIAALFTQSCEVGSNDGEAVGAGDGTETAGGFLLEFGHANIAFSLIVVKWYARVGEKAQYVLGVLSQADEQIDRGRLFDTPPAPWPLSRWRIVAFAFVEDGAVSAPQVQFEFEHRISAKSERSKGQYTLHRIKWRTFNSSHAWSAMIRLAGSLVAIAVLSVLTSNLAYALPDELEIHLDDTTEKGKFGFDMISNYAISGPRVPSDEGLRPTRHLLQLSPNISYGVTKNTQVGLQLFSSVGLDGQARIDGGRVELLTIPIRPPDNDDDGYWLGALFEVGHLPATLSTNHLDSEIKILFGARKGRWTIGASPEFGFKVSGSGSGSQPEIEMKLKIAYRLDSGYSIGIEQYSDLGTTRKIGPLNQQSQQTFAVVDFKRKDWDFNIGVGRGWNDFSEKWVVKTIIGFSFGD